VCPLVLRVSSCAVKRQCVGKDKCDVCQFEYAATDRVITLPCKHFYHSGFWHLAFPPRQLNNAALTQRTQWVIPPSCPHPHARVGADAALFSASKLQSDTECGQDVSRNGSRPIARVRSAAMKWSRNYRIRKALGGNRSVSGGRNPFFFLASAPSRSTGDGGHWGTIPCPWCGACICRNASRVV